jgi:dienelactone hydrolase
MVHGVPRPRTIRPAIRGGYYLLFTSLLGGLVASNQLAAAQTSQPVSFKNGVTRGSGTSTGDFETASFRDLAADGIAGVQYLARRADIDRGRIGVWGISQGGWLGPLAATMSRDIAFVVAVSASGVSPAEQMDFAAKYTLEQSGQPASVVQQTLAVRGKVNDYYRGRVSKPEAEQAVQAIRSAPWFEQVYLPPRCTCRRIPRGPSGSWRWTTIRWRC